MNVESFTTSSVTLSWKVPVSDGGDKVEGYYIERCLDGSSDWTRCNVQPFINTTGQVTGLREGRTYQFRVRAANSSGLGEPSPETTPVTAQRPDGTLLNLLMNFQYMILISF